MKKLLLIALAVVIVGCAKKVQTDQETSALPETSSTGTTNAPTGVPPTVVPPTGVPPAGFPPPGMTDVTNQKSTLIVTNSMYSLKPAHPVDSSIVELSCGCHFDFIVESYTGDTKAITYKQFDAKTAQAYKVGLRFTGNPNAPKGPHQVKLAFLNTGKKGDYRDTITVNYTI